MSDYYTHRKFLEKELEELCKFNRTVKCLEFGTGDGSASIFNKFAIKNKNILISAYDSDKTWLEETAKKYSSVNYNFYHVDSWDSILNKNLFGDTYDLVFVDQSPWEARIKTIDIFLNKTNIIILHDYDY